MKNIARREWKHFLGAFNFFCRRNSELRFYGSEQTVPAKCYGDSGYGFE